MRICQRVPLHEISLPASYSRLACRVLQRRPLTSEKDLQLHLASLPSPDSLLDIQPACERIIQALQRDEQIMIVADFDVDGATSCALLMRGLKAMGTKKVNYMVPNRFDYGYGLSPEIVAEGIAKYQPQLIITVDNGISNVEGVALANDQGVDVIITDHHLPGDELPAAVAIVNPNRKGDEFPSKVLAGVGVTFYVLLALRTRLRAQNWFNDQRPEPNMAEYLDLVAFGTVADVVPLDHCNRILVQQGLQRIRQGCCTAGIKALIQVAGRKQAYLTATDIAFGLAPKLNAAGRMANMEVGIDCLLTDHLEEARELTLVLMDLNEERRSLEAEMREQAAEIIDSLKANAVNGDLPMGLTLYDPSWHQGVIGILAARMKEAFNRPIFVFAKEDRDQTLIKGSGRSIEGFHLRDALESINEKYQGLLTRFGGHAMAAGLSIKEADFALFTQAFAEYAQGYLGQEDLSRHVLTDGSLHPEEFSLQNAQEIAHLGPWGQAFPEPIFDGFFYVENAQVLKGIHVKLQIRPVGGDMAFDAIAFYQADQWPSEQPPNKIQCVFGLEINRWLGEERLQLRVIHIQMA